MYTHKQAREQEPGRAAPGVAAGRTGRERIRRQPRQMEEQGSQRTGGEHVL